MAELEFRAATPEDLQVILAHARQENIDELQVCDGLGLEKALSESIENSREAFVFVIDGEPVCAFGVVPAPLPNVGIPWMVGTSNIDHHGTAFLRASKKVLAELMTRWPVLTNWADSRNTRGLRWLRFMGFTIHPAIPLGEKGLLFHRFEKGVL